MANIAPRRHECVAAAGIRRIVCITHFFPTRKGGIEAVAHEINRRLATTGIAVDWFASAGSGVPDTIPGLQYRPVKAIHVVERLTGLPLPLWLSPDVMQLRASMRTCDAVHIHDFIYPGSLLALVWALRLKKPVILTQHIGHIPYRSRALTLLLTTLNRTLGGWALRRATRVVFISNAVEAYFRGFATFAAPPRYLPNGVDVDVFHPVDTPTRDSLRGRLGIAQGEHVCLFVGRFVEKKGLALLAELVRCTPHLRWLFAGEGPLHPGTWGAPNVEVFEGRRRERLADLYRAADVLVLPSRGEGFPLVVQEAFACGTPVLISDEAAAGCEKARPLLFEQAIAGEDIIAHWQARLDALFSDPAMLEARRPAVASFARTEWSWEQAVAAYARLYAEACAESATG